MEGGKHHFSKLIMRYSRDTRRKEMISMTKAEFDTLLNKAASGNLQSMRGIAMLCFKMAEGVMAHDTRKATIYVEF